MIRAEALEPAAAPGLDPRLRLALVLGLFPLHLLLVAASVGLRTEHFVVDAAFAAAFFAGPRVARFALLALPFWAVGACYEALPLVLPLRGEIHVGDLLNHELALFGIGTPDGPVTPAKWFQTRTHPVLDTVCGLAYLFYLGETFLFGAYLYFKDQNKMMVLAWGFFAVNLLGMITYVLYPAAPPWYVDLYGSGPANLAAKPDPAGAARFDALWNVGLFASFYSRNANVFGAMPSLHCAYPTLVIWVAASHSRKLIVPAIMFQLLVAFSAIYLNHHYVLDVLAGVTYATATYFAVRWVVRRVSSEQAPEGVPIADAH